MSQTDLLIANWKSHKSLDEALEWWSEIQPWLSRQAAVLQKRAKVVIAPPYPLLAALAEKINQHAELADFVALGVQDLSPFPVGSYTGAVTAHNLAGLNVKYALVGHSERRRYFHETHQEVANKVSQALEAGITPVVCVDEPYVQAQAAAIVQAELRDCVVAYEPLEAIGSGLNQSIEEVTTAVAEVQAAFGSVPVLYGGSVAADNVGEYVAATDGVLVGGQSQQAADFMALIRAVE